MSAPTAAGLLKLLAKRRTMAALSELDGMNDAHYDVLRRSLTAVPAGSRIDIPMLLDSVRREVTERIAAEAERRKANACPFRHAIQVMDDTALRNLHNDLKRRVAAGLGNQPFTLGALGSQIALPLPAVTRARLHAKDDAEPDDLGDEPDDEPDDRPRPARRRRWRRRLQATPEPPPPQTPARDETRASRRLRPVQSPAPLLGPRVLDAASDSRPFGCPDDVSDFEAWRNPAMPPWLIQENEREEA